MIGRRQTGKERRGEGKKKERGVKGKEKERGGR